MSSALTPPSPSSNFQALFDAALIKYTKYTGKDLRDHSLAFMIDRCESPDAILDIIQEQSQAFDEFRNGNPRLIEWLTPVVEGLHAISTNAFLNAGASLVFPPANLIFSGIGVLLSVAKCVRESYDALVDIFECIQSFTTRLKIYTEIQPPLAITEMIIKIMAEILGVLALATKHINQGRLKKYARKLLGENDFGSILRRLDRLTLEESKVTIAHTLDVVHGLVNNMEVAMEDGKTSTDDMRRALVLMQELVMEANKIKRDQLRDNVRRWLSAPDPWTNHNIARKAYHRGTATWFTQGDVFGTWKSTGHLLWIQGLPGSGKTVLCSSIIEEVHNMCQMGLAAIAFFYFDFRDGDKQDVRRFLSSILTQLCGQSDQYSEVLSALFTKHDDGSRQPSEDALMECLKSMLAFLGQGSLYLIVDALDECPNSSGYPTPREEVLDVMRALIDMQLPHVHFCITSRPEMDIREVLEPLAIHNVPLHEQAGQRQDIVNYINHFVRSDTKVRRWREEDKQLVIETLMERASGMFRWVHCQLNTLRRCFPPSIRHVLDDLPKTLDETYERILGEIDAEKKAYTRRLFQCLVVAIRPLCVDELAEFFAVLFEPGSAPGFNIGWRPEDPEEFILSACSTLVAIVDVEGRRIVQFSHFSVREYLTSSRIADSRPLSYFQILPKPAHALLAKACLSILLQLDDRYDKTAIQEFPLASYAAEHWADHARFDDVSSEIRDGMHCLFDESKPHFATWINMFNLDNFFKFGQDEWYESSAEPRGVPLYYAALYGFRELARHLLNLNQQDVNARGGHRETPLLAALSKGHPDIALLLLEHGADVDPRDQDGQTALYKASSLGYAEVVQSLIDCGADPNIECDDWKMPSGGKWTPLLTALRNGSLETARVLLSHGANVKYNNCKGTTALHFASSYPSDDIVRSLLDGGLDPDASDFWGSKALHRASMTGQTTVVKLLLEYGANVDALDGWGRTPLHCAAGRGELESIQLLLDHGADANAKDSYQTALHLAAGSGHLQIVEILLKRGADPHARNFYGDKTPFQLASEEKHTQIAQLLSEHTGERM